MALDPALHAELGVARLAAERAGALIAERWDGAFEIHYKGEVDLVSEVDLASEALIVEMIHEAFPHDQIIAEEGSARAGESARTWHIDPLDGTTNFSHGLPHFCVSIALVDASGVRVGVVYDPIRRWTFSALRGGGAWLNGRRLSVSDANTLDHTLFATGFPYDRRTNPDNNLDRFGHVLHHTQGGRRAGSAALDLAFLAAGWLDAYWEDRLQSWDLAAGVLLVLEAGGCVSALSGEPFVLADGHIIASTPPLHAQLVAALLAPTISESHP